MVIIENEVRLYARLALDVFSVKKLVLVTVTIISVPMTFGNCFLSPLPFEVTTCNGFP